MTDGTLTDSVVVRDLAPLAPLAVPKASEVMASVLRDRILAGDYSEGDALPSERELVLQTQISRTSVREALRTLEAQGFVAVKKGRAGGAFVRLPGKEAVARTVSMFIKGRRLRIDSLLETREGIEPALARMAAGQRTDDELARMEAANLVMASPAASLSRFLQANVDWHVSVAEASHNELLMGFMAALSQAVYLATDNQQFVSRDIRQATARAHEAVTQAIRDHDGEAAARRMTKHLHEYAEAVALVEDRVDIEI